MPELILIRHGQASFGAADYDVLSERGHRQAKALGLALRAHGPVPDALFMGAQRRHRETMNGVMEGLGETARTPSVLDGLNEFDFRAILTAKYGEDGPPGLHDDRRTHFRLLRETALEWQADAIDGVPERFGAFRDRVMNAVETMLAGPHDRVAAVSSGGPIALTVATVLEAPLAQMLNLQLQMKNCAVTRLIFTRSRRYLHTFNETPHIDARSADDYLTYS